MDLENAGTQPVRVRKLVCAFDDMHTMLIEGRVGPPARLTMSHIFAICSSNDNDKICDWNPSCAGILKLFSPICTLLSSHTQSEHSHQPPGNPNINHHWLATQSG